MVPITIQDAAVRSFILYSSILAVKVMAMTVLTAYMRHKKKAFANEEDAKLSKGVVKFDDPDVERIRRAHLNDLENIPLFWFLGALYLTTGPSPLVAVNLFRVFVFCRIVHTIVYAIVPLPQPIRGIAFDIPFLINVFMGANVIVYFISAF